MLGIVPVVSHIERDGKDIIEIDTVHIPREKFVAINLGGTTDIEQFKGLENTDIKI